MRSLLPILVVALVALAPPVVIDYFFVRSGQNHESIWYSPWLNLPAYGVAPVGFYFSTLAFFRKHSSPWRYIYPAFASGALTVLWFFLAITVIVNFHFSFGGRL
jgi:hypothetical protein